MPQHHSVTLDINAPAAGSAGELRVLPRGQINMRLAVPLNEFLQHNRTRRHVYAQGQCLGGKDNFKEVLLEETLDHLLEERKQSGVMGGNTSFKPRQPFLIAQGREVSRWQGAGRFEGDLANGLPLWRGSEAKSGIQALSDGVIAPCTAEQEVDGRQHARPFESINGIATPRGVCASGPMAAPAATRPSTSVRAEFIACQTLKFGIHPVMVTINEEIVEAGSSHNMLGKRNGSMLLDDDVGIAPHRGQPGPELLCIADRC